MSSSRKRHHSPDVEAIEEDQMMETNLNSSDLAENEFGEELSGEECLNRCQQFMEISQTNIAEATSILQDCHWNVSRALFQHFAWNQLDSITAPDPGNISEATNASSVATCSTSSSEGYIGNRLRILSWNLDGLDDKNLEARMNFVVDCILRDRCHIVLLQEVVTSVEKILRKRLESNYKFWIPADSSDYYCAILTHIATICVPGGRENSPLKVIPFPQSSMGRELLQLRCMFNQKPLIVMTSHLESTRAFSDERKRQLRICWDTMITLSKQLPQAAIFFGGDLNLREREVKEMNNLPEEIQDLWHVCGSRKEASSTWDPKRNYNAGQHLQGLSGGGANARFITDNRYDRLYLLQANKTSPFNPRYFELTGLEKVPNHQCNASDHWAILCHLDVE